IFLVFLSANLNMNKRNISLLFFILICVSNLIFQFNYNNILLSFLNSDLPFREAYFPNFLGVSYTYFFPLLSGYIFGGIFSSYKNKFVYYLNLSLLAGLINFIPFLFNNTYGSWLLSLAIPYYLILFPL